MKIDEPSLFDEDVDYRTLRPIRDVTGLARYGDPDTSHAAVEKIRGRTERLILQHFRYGGPATQGWTADELCRELPTIYPPTLKSALSRLAKQGLIVATDQTRASDRGCAQTVYLLEAAPAV